jgi:HlyD family secretion protein
MKRAGIILISVLSFWLHGCGSGVDGRMVGELAWDRVELTNETAEPISAIKVQEGQMVAAGTLLVQLNTTRAEAVLASVLARVTEAERELERQQQLIKRQLTSPELVDKANSAWVQAKAEEQKARLVIDRLSIRASHAGRVDSLPFEVGELPPVGSVLAVLLVGDAPYARLYVPESLRSHVAVGDGVQVEVDGRDSDYQGKVRRIASDASFTPFYALSQHDRSKLVYVAEVTLSNAADLPSGLPVEGVLLEKSE